MKKIIVLIFISTHLFLFAQSPSDFSLLKKDGVTQSIASGNPAGNGIGRIIAMGDTVWLGLGNGISYSTDNGESWTSKSFGSEGVAAIGYDKYHRVFWVSTVHNENISDIGDIQVGSGLHYTSDFGTTWTFVSEPVDSPGDSIMSYGINNSVRALPITVPQQNIIWHMDFTPDNIWIACWAGGIRRSSDMGQTWQRVLLPSDSLNSLTPNDTVEYALSPQTGKFGVGYLNFLGFSVLTLNDSTVYVGTVNGINVTTDADTQYPSWIKFNHYNQQNAISGDWVWTIKFNPVDSTLWAATWKGEGYTEYQAVSFSTDFGENWKVVLPHERVNDFSFKDNQPIAPSDNGLFRSSDLGNTWLTPGYIYDEKTKASITTNNFYSAATSGNVIWIGSGDGLARLTETGTAMWQGIWKVYNSAPIAKEVYAFPNPFNPRLDEKIVFKYDTGNKNANVTIRIFDFGMNYLRTVIQNAPRQLVPSDPPIDSWNGRDDNGNFVSNGVYFYRIEVGSNDPLFGKIIVIK